MTITGNRWLSRRAVRLLPHIIRLAVAGSLLVLALSMSAPDPSALTQSCGSCPDVCGIYDCSCGEFDCGSAEFCSISGPSDFCRYPGSGCAAGEVYYNGCCATLGTPILLDLAGDGLRLTNLASGVTFAIGPGAQAYPVSWTEPASDDAWLVLDRNGNGTIDDGTELFGNNTPQADPPSGHERNGYLALAVYDDPARGGNGDGRITTADAIYGVLRLWRDRNHNGVSEPRELSTLASEGVVDFGLDYRLSKRTDRFGNIFRYRAKVAIDRGERSGTTTWSVDVFLLIGRSDT